MALTGKIKGWAWSLIAKHSSVPVYWGLPFGCDLTLDIETLLPKFRAEMVFDVGANVGQSACLFLERWPEAQIHCFEPVRSTFEALQARLGSHDKVQLHRLAFSTRAGVGNMIVDEHSTRSALTASDVVPKDATLEEVPLSTLDGFCETQGIARINFLKVDTEGADLDVLRGGERMLGASAIGLLQVEAGMYPGNEKHISLEALKSYLEEKGYLLFGIYDQHPERLSRRSILRRANPVFISSELADQCGRAVDWKKAQAISWRFR